MEIQLTYRTIIAIFFIIILYFIAKSISHYISLKLSRRYSQTSFPELLLILKTIIDTELDVYEKSVFLNRQGITNANYENYYNEITKHIIDSIPENYYEQMSKYLTKEAVITYICHLVHQYLQEKIYIAP